MLRKLFRTRTAEDQPRRGTVSWPVSLAVGLFLGVAGWAIGVSVLQNPTLELTITDDDTGVTNAVVVLGTLSGDDITIGGSTWNAATPTSGKTTLTIDEGASGTLTLGVTTPTSYTQKIRVVVVDTDNDLGLRGTGSWQESPTGTFTDTITTYDNSAVTGKHMYRFLSVGMTTLQNEVVDGNRDITFTFKAVP